MREDRMKTSDEFEDEFDLGDIDDEEDEAFAEDSNSGRSFWLVTLGMAALILLVVGGLFYYTGAWKPASPKPPAVTAIEAVIKETPVQEMTIPALLTAEEAEKPAELAATATRVYENTPVDSDATTTRGNADAPEEAARTATVAALLTESALAATQPVVTTETSPVQPTEAPVVLVTPPAQTTALAATPSPTALPDTGWADEVGMPLMFGLGGALILVIILTRILRSSRAA